MVTPYEVRSRSRLITKQDGVAYGTPIFERELALKSMMLNVAQSHVTKYSGSK